MYPLDQLRALQAARAPLSENHTSTGQQKNSHVDERFQAVERSVHECRDAVVVEQQSVEAAHAVESQAVDLWNAITAQVPGEEKAELHVTTGKQDDRRQQPFQTMPNKPDTSLGAISRFELIKATGPAGSGTGVNAPHWYSDASFVIKTNPWSRAIHPETALMKYPRPLLWTKDGNGTAKTFTTFRFTGKTKCWTGIDYVIRAQLRRCTLLLVPLVQNAD